MAGMAGEFMTNWQSSFFRDRILAQIRQAKDAAHPDPDSPDTMEQFLAQNNCEQLEQFIYDKSKQREDYLSLAADLLMAIRQCRGKPGQGREQLNGQAESVPNGEATPNGDHSQQETEI